MRKIRNEFAHHVEYKNFYGKPICNYINSMPSKEDAVIKTLDYDKRPEKLSSRAKFLVRSSLAVLDLIRDMAGIQAAIKHHIDPRSIFGSFESMPENMKVLARTTSRITLKILLGELPT